MPSLLNSIDWFTLKKKKKNRVIILIILLINYKLYFTNSLYGIVSRIVFRCQSAAHTGAGPLGGANAMVK